MLNGFFFITEASLFIQDLNRNISYFKFVLKILSGNGIMMDGITELRMDGVIDNPNPIKPPLFQSGTINTKQCRSRSAGF